MAAGRIFPGATEDVLWKEDHTPESVREHLAAIGSTEAFRTPDSVGTSMAISLSRLGIGGTEPLALDLRTRARGDEDRALQAEA
ncbi:hypothetical protein AB0D97_36190 [Streptomyces roseus]|uniref:hypothetical protein n=1 Tax=Streptomyces roseus TaxID=66430 RepID=UPI0033E68C04